MAITPTLVRENTVCTSSQNGTLTVFELAQFIIERDNLCRADECEIERVEEQANPFAVEIFQRKLSELIVAAIFAAVTLALICSSPVKLNISV